MANPPPADVLEFLRRNKFTQAEAALRTELGNRFNLTGVVRKLKSDDKELHSEGVNGGKELEQGRNSKNFHHSVEGLKDLNSSENSQELIVREVECGTGGSGCEHNWRTCGAVGEPRMVDVSVGTSDTNLNFFESLDDTVLDLYTSKYSSSNGLVHSFQNNAKPQEDASLSINEATADPNYGRRDKHELKELDQKRKPSVKSSKDDLSDDPWSRSDEFTSSTSKHWNDWSVEAGFLLSWAGMSSSCDGAAGIDKRDGKREMEYQEEELPRLTPVRLKTEDKSVSIHWEEKFEGGEAGQKIPDVDDPYVIGSSLDVRIGLEINVSGDRLSDSVDFPNELWESDEYEDDDDIGYTRQPIEDETWFLAHEIDYLSDNEKGTGQIRYPDTQEMERNKNDEDDPLFTEGDSYFSGEQYFQSTNVNRVVFSGNPGGLCESELVGQYIGQLMDEEELNLICSEPAWQGFLTQTDELLLKNQKVIGECGRPHSVDDDLHGSVRSIGVGINSDAADIGSEARESLSGDIECFHDHDARISRHSRHDLDEKTVELTANDSYRMKRQNSDLYTLNNNKGMYMQSVSHTDGGFSFPPPLSLSNSSYAEREHVTKEEHGNAAAVRDEDPKESFEDEEAAAVQEQVKQIKAQEKEFETFDLKIIHRKNRTGFEEDKNFHVNLNSVIAGRYHITEYLGSAAFSKAVQAHDLHTGMDVCMKIIKNNKDFFDQSLDEIKLLKYVNKKDPADKYHLLRLYDYFYYREHLLIVCELLKANLYEFQKFNRESGGEVYFTMPRLQSIAIQCLEALQFLHGLGLIHCDLKPENILVKSYSRCEVKVIDLGSSCYETDNLSSYVQSRSYRAPEVILGLPYDKKVDIWSLGCILAELCTGNVLFQNDSLATLLARVIGIISPIEVEMLAKGQDTRKYFTKSHMLYERNQETNRLEYLIPKKSSLRHRLPMGDQGFVDFVAHLLEVNPQNRPSSSEALKHPWLQYPYEPLSY